MSKTSGPLVALYKGSSNVLTVNVKCHCSGWGQVASHIHPSINFASLVCLLRCSFNSFAREIPAIYQCTCDKIAFGASDLGGFCPQMIKNVAAKWRR